MTTSEDYRRMAAEYAGLAATTKIPVERRRLQLLQQECLLCVTEDSSRLKPKDSSGS